MYTRSSLEQQPYSKRAVVAPTDAQQSFEVGIRKHCTQSVENTNVNVTSNDHWPPYPEQARPKTTYKYTRKVVGDQVLPLTPDAGTLTLTQCARSGVREKGMVVLYARGKRSWSTNGDGSELVTDRELPTGVYHRTQLKVT